MLERAGIFCKFIAYFAEWAQSRGTLVWHGQSKDFVALLLGVEGTWVQFVMQAQFCVWLVLDGVVYVRALSCW